jgi:hypothetical protein
MVHHVALLVRSTPSDHGEVAEHVAYRLGQRLATVEDEQDALGSVQAAVAQRDDQAAHDRRVLRGTLDHAEGLSRTSALHCSTRRNRETASAS